MDNFLRFCATMFVFILHGRSHIPGMSNASDLFRMATSLPAWAGVWIFFFLSGYGLGMGFEKNRYGLISEKGFLDIKNLLKFYVSRFLKLAPLYYGYLIAFEVMSGGAVFWGNKELFLRMFTFTFNGNGGASGVGHLWYVSIVMQLYLILPFLYYILRKLNSQRTIILCIFVNIFLGLAARVLLYQAGKDWYSDIYTNVFVNIDLAVGGLLTAKLNTKPIKTHTTSFRRMAAVAGFVGLVVYNCIIYYLNTGVCIYIYRMILPSMYLLACYSLLILWNDTGDQQKKKSGWGAVQCLSLFSQYSYGIYIFHIATFYYLKGTLQETALYQDSTIYTQYVLFYICSFTLCILLTALLANSAKIMSWKWAKPSKRVVASIVVCFLAVSFVMPVTANAAEKVDQPWEGSGSKENPYLLENADDLVMLSRLVNQGEHYEGIYFRQTANIDLAGVDWVLIGRFSTDCAFMGIYDGDGHYVENLSILPQEGYSSNVGFFGHLGGTVMNFGIESGEIRGACVGSISSHAYSSEAVILNCYSKAHVTGARAGGIADNFNGSILNCWTDCVLDAGENGRTGAIVSYSAKSQQNCFGITEFDSVQDLVDRMNSGIFEVSALGGKNFRELNQWFLDDSGTVGFEKGKVSIGIGNVADLLFGYWLYAVPAVLFLTISALTLLPEKRMKQNRKDLSL